MKERIVIDSGFMEQEFMRNVAEDMLKKLSEDRDRICIERLHALGVPFIPSEEESRRFKRFMREIKGNEETLYYNDGSVEGLRIVTFVTKQTPFDPETMSIGFTVTYY